MAEPKLLVPLRPQEERSTGLDNKTIATLEYNATRKAILDNKPVRIPVPFPVQTPVQTPELNAAVGNTPDFVAPSQQDTKEQPKPLTNEEQAQEIMGLYNQPDFSPEGVAKSMWQAAGVDNAEDYRRVSQEETRKELNDLNYFLFGGGALLAAESGLENTVSSFAEAGRAINDFITDRRNPLQEAMESQYAPYVDKSRDVSNKVGDYLLAFADEQARAGQDAMEIARSNVNGTVGEVLLDTAAAGAQMVGDIVIGAATGGSSMVPMAIRSFGSGVQEARNKGYTLEQQLALGLSSAAIEYITEKFFGGNPFYDKAEAGLINRAIQRLGGNEQLLAFLSSTPVETLNEGLEEILSGVLNPAMEYIIAGKADPIVLDELLKEGVVGVLLGASGQAANYVYNRQTGKANQTQEQDTGNLLADALLSQQEQTQQQTTAQTDTAQQTDTTVEDMRKKLSDPVNRSQADKIVNNPKLAAAFTEVTGIQLRGTKSERAKAVMAASGVDYTQTQTQETAQDQQQEKTEEEQQPVQDNGELLADVLTGQQNQQGDAAEQNIPVAPVEQNIQTSEQGIAQPVQQETVQPPTEATTDNPLTEAMIGQQDAVGTQAEDIIQTAPASQNGEPAQTQPTPVVNVENDGGNLYGRSVGAATPDAGPPVPTQSKPVTESNWMPEEAKEIAQPGTHERISEARSMGRAEAMFAVNEYGDIVNAADVSEELLAMPDGTWSGVDSDGAMIAARALWNQGDVEGFRKIMDRYNQEGSHEGQAMQARKKWVHTPEGKVAEAGRIIDEAIKDGRNSKKANAAENEVREIVSAVENSVPDAANAATDQTAYDLIREIYDAFQQEEGQNGNGRNWIAQMADTLASKVSKNATRTETQRTKTVAQQMLSDLVRLTRDAAPKAQRQAQNTNANTEAFQNFLTNRAEYEQAVAWAQKRIAEDYADNPEMLRVFNEWLANGISLSNMVSKVIQENGVRINEILRDSWEDKNAAVNRVVESVLSNMDLTEAQAQEAAQIIYGRFWQEVMDKSRAIVERYVKPSEPRTKTPLMDRFMEMYNLGAFSDASLRDAVYEKMGLPVLTEKDTNQIYTLMEKAQQLRETDPRQAHKLEAQADKIIASKVHVSFRNKVIRALMDGMLGNFRTLISRNAGGNLIFAIPETLAKLPTAAVDAATSIFTGERYYAMPDAKQAKAYVKGFKRGITETIEDFKWDVHTPRSGETLDYSAQIKPFSNWACNAIDKMIQTGLEVSDRSFYEANYDARMAELNRLRDQGKLSKEMMEKFDDLAPVEARLSALESVFQSEGKMAEGLAGLKNAVQNIIDSATGIGLGGQFSIPFTKTPGNILQRTTEYLPGLGTVKNLLTTGGEIARGEFNQRRFSRETGRNITGLGIAALAAQAVAAGVIAGGGDDRPDEELLEQSGWQEYSIKIGDRYYSYDWIPILGPMMAGTADFINALDDESDNPLLNAIGTGLQSTAEMSALSGLSRMFGGYSGVVSGLGDMLLGGTSQAVPSIVRQAARATDDYERSTYDPNKLKQQWNYIKSGIPGLRQTLPVRYDLFGNPVEISDGRSDAAKWFENLISPSYVSQEQRDQRTDEMLRLRDAGYNVPVPDISKKRDIDGDGVNDALTAEELSMFTQSRNATFGDLATAFFGSESYDAMSDESRSLLLSEAMKYATAMANAELYAGRGEEYNLDNWMVDAAESSDPARYIQVYRTFTIASNDRHRDYEALDGLMNLYGQLPESERDSMSDSSGTIGRLYDASRNGVSAENWYRANDAVRELNPLPGNDGVANYQKLEAILDNASGDDIDVLLPQYLSGYLPEKYAMARDAGFSPERFVEFYTVYNTTESDYKNGESLRNVRDKIVADLVGRGWSEKWANRMYALFKASGTELDDWEW